MTARSQPPLTADGSRLREFVAANSHLHQTQVQVFARPDGAPVCSIAGLARRVTFNACPFVTLSGAKNLTFRTNETLRVRRIAIKDGAIAPQNDDSVSNNA